MKKLLFSLAFCITLAAPSLFASAAGELLGLSTLPIDPNNSAMVHDPIRGGARLCKWSAWHEMNLKKLKAKAIKWKNKRMKASKKYSEGKMAGWIYTSKKPDFTVCNEIIAKLDVYVEFFKQKSVECTQGARAKKSAKAKK